MWTTLFLRSPILTSSYRTTIRFRREKYHSSLNDLEKLLLKKLGTSLAESMETTQVDLIIISPFSGQRTVEEEQLAILETINPAVTYVPVPRTLGD